MNAEFLMRASARIELPIDVAARHQQILVMRFWSLFVEPHQQRVVDEKTELDSKIAKLRDFVEAAKQPDIFATLPQAEQQRLKKQYFIMAQYSDILRERIANFPSA